MIDPAELPRRPVTALVIASALGVTLHWWMGGSIRLFVLSPSWPTEPWRVLSSALPHVNVFHLGFNLVWTAVFGLAVEQHYGSGKTALLYAFWTAASGLAEHAFFRGGVGLSGLGYALFGFLWMLHRRGHPLGRAIDPPTVRLFIGWFFLCIVLTMTGTWNIANVAHGAGALFGVLVGLGIQPHGRPWLGLAAALSVLVVLLAGPLRPMVNLGTYGL